MKIESEKLQNHFNACFDFHGTRNGTTETVISLISPQNYISDAEQCVGERWTLLEVGECALKIYWKVNIIKNFFYCILHASFQSLSLSLVRCRSVVDSSIMETSSNICCAIVNAFLFYILAYCHIFWLSSWTQWNRTEPIRVSYFNSWDCFFVAFSQGLKFLLRRPHSKSCKSAKGAVNVLITHSSPSRLLVDGSKGVSSRETRSLRFTAVSESLSLFKDIKRDKSSGSGIKTQKPFSHWFQ